MTTATITFPQPAKRLSMNDRMHWAPKAKLTHEWRTAARYAANDLGEFPPATVHVTFPVRDKRRRDPHNTAPTVKAIVDGLVDAGVWPDDTDQYVVVMDPTFSKETTDVIVELRARDWGLTA